MKKLIILGFRCYICMCLFCLDKVERPSFDCLIDLFFEGLIMSKFSKVYSGLNSYEQDEINALTEAWKNDPDPFFRNLSFNLLNENCLDELSVYELIKKILELHRSSNSDQNEFKNGIESYCFSNLGKGPKVDKTYYPIFIGTIIPQDKFENFIRKNCKLVLYDDHEIDTMIDDMRKGYLSPILENTHVKPVNTIVWVSWSNLRGKEPYVFVRYPSNAHNEIITSLGLGFPDYKKPVYKFIFHARSYPSSIKIPTILDSRMNEFFQVAPSPFFHGKTRPLNNGDVYYGSLVYKVDGQPEGIIWSSELTLGMAETFDKVRAS
jgi:hypothetical protein